jgi:hypothetical protein
MRDQVGIKIKKLTRVMQHRQFFFVFDVLLYLIINYTWYAKELFY